MLSAPMMYCPSMALALILVACLVACAGVLVYYVFKG